MEGGALSVTVMLISSKLSRGSNSWHLLDVLNGNMSSNTRPIATENTPEYRRQWQQRRKNAYWAVDLPVMLIYIQNFYGRVRKRVAWSDRCSFLAQCSLLLHCLRMVAWRIYVRTLVYLGRYSGFSPHCLDGDLQESAWVKSGAVNSKGVIITSRLSTTDKRRRSTNEVWMKLDWLPETKKQRVNSLSPVCPVIQMRVVCNVENSREWVTLWFTKVYTGCLHWKLSDDWILCTLNNEL
jgi:hypothetical protein